MIANEDFELYRWLLDAARYGGSFVRTMAEAAFRADAENYELLRHDEGLYRLNTFDSMDLYPYAQLESDVRALLREFMRFVRCKQLDGYLRKENSKMVTQ